MILARKQKLFSKVFQIRFQVVLACNEETQVSRVLAWKSKKLRRIVSSTAAEALEANEIVDEHNTYYKKKKNTLGVDGKLLKCLQCQSEYHLLNRCEHRVARDKYSKKSSNKKETLTESG